jgi:hypothetical protein
MSARLSALVVALLVALTHASTAHAAPPVERSAPAGTLEFGLAGVMMGVGVGMVAFGSVELVRTREHQRRCAQGTSGVGIDSCLFDPPRLGYAAVGLSWGFAVPLVVGSGLLFARGARVRRDARRGAQSSVTPWWNRAGGGVTFTLRF